MSFPGCHEILSNAKVRLDSMAKAKEDAVANSQQMLEEDAKKFEDYLQVRETHCFFCQTATGIVLVSGMM